MLFKRYHIYPMHTGLKTHTRRLWKKPHCKIGGTYDITHRMYYTPEDVVGQIYVTSMYRQPLGMMTGLDAIEEGGYDLTTYRMVLDEISKEVVPNTTVLWVIKFRFILSDIIDGNGGTNDIDAYRDEYVAHMKRCGIEARV